jgi:hypothetical protein
VQYFSERLVEHAMPRGAFVVNRFRVPPMLAGVRIAKADVDASIAAYGLALEDDAAERLIKAHEDACALADLDARHVRALGGETGVPIVRVRELASDVHDLKLLSQIAEMLMSGGV